MNENYYVVEKIVGKKVEKGEELYLVKWEGWPDQFNTWENFDNLHTAP